MMKKKITNIPDALGWQGRERDFHLMQELYGKEHVQYTLFHFKEKRTFEKKYKSLNTKEEYVYVCKGTLKELLNDLQIYHFNKNEFVATDSNVLQLELLQIGFRDSFVRQPKKRTIEGVFYQLTEEEFQGIPFESYPITSRREGFPVTKLYDSVQVNDVLKKYFSTHFAPIITNENCNDRMKYRPIVKEREEDYVPKIVHPKAFEMAKRYELNHLEFNFLNYFYEMNMSLRNEVGKMFYDISSNGSEYTDKRKWVKRKMERLIALGLVKFEMRREFIGKRNTNWYFYDVEANLDTLEHRF